MNAATPSSPTPPLSNADVVNASPQGDPPQMPDIQRLGVISRRRIMRAGAIGSPVRRSPRLSGPPPPGECWDTQDLDQSGGNESESVEDVTFQLSREETPENEAFPPDEPSTILVNRIARAHDNPSPPPQDLAHLGISYLLRKDDRLLPLGVSPPPSPFRPVNLLERLDQFLQPSFDRSHSLRNPILGNQAELSETCIVSPRGSISLEASVTSVPTKGAPHEDLGSTGAVPSSSAQYTTSGFPSRSLPHVCEPANFLGDAGAGPSSIPVAGLHERLMTTTTSVGPEASGLSPIRVVDSSLNSLIPPTHDIKTMVSGVEHIAAQEASLVENSNLSVLEERGSKCSAAAKGIDANSHQRLGSLSPHSTDVLAGLRLTSEPTPSIKQTNLSAESISVEHPPRTPPRTPKLFSMRSNVSRSATQRPFIPPTPARATDVARKLHFSLKFSEVDDIYRTPAQRVPIEAALAGTSSLQRTVFTGSEKSQLRHFLTIRTPVFTRPTLDDPSRSPAKRIPVTGLIASPARGEQAQSSPTRPSLRARSASVEPRQVVLMPSRSRSVEPSAMVPAADSHGKPPESIFPMAPMNTKSRTKLPFSFATGQKSSSDLPPPIPEERENAEIRNTEANATLNTVVQVNAMSQLRQPSTNSRIPRIGSKPYARPPAKSPKAAASTTTVSVVRAPKVLSFQTGCKSSGVGNSNTDAVSTQPANDQRLLGSLKRKRGAEATALSNPIMIRQVVPGILDGKYASKSAKFLGQAQLPSDTSPPKAPQPLKFRKVVDGMLTARYTPTVTNLAHTGNSPPPLSPLSEISSSSNELSDERLPSTAHPSTPRGQTSDTSQTNGDGPIAVPNVQKRSSLHRHTDNDESSNRPRRASRSRKPAQQQYVLDVFNGNTTTRPPPVRRKPRSGAEGDGFMGMSATALKALTTSNTAKNQQTVAVLATEVIRKEGPRPESPMVKARTTLQKQRDERDRRRLERAERRARTSEEALGGSDTEGQIEVNDRVPLGARVDHDENDYTIPQKHPQGPGDEEDYETPERPERTVEPLRFDKASGKAQPAKQVKWHRGLSTFVYLDEVDPKPRSLSKDVVRGCLAPTSKNLALDPLGNLADIDSRSSPELVAEQIVVKRYLYDNDIEPEPIPTKVTRSKNKKSRS